MEKASQAVFRVLQRRNSWNTYKSWVFSFQITCIYFQPSEQRADLLREDVSPALCWFSQSAQRTYIPHVESVASLTPPLCICEVKWNKCGCVGGLQRIMRYLFPFQEKPKWENLHKIETNVTGKWGMWRSVGAWHWSCMGAMSPVTTEVSGWCGCWTCLL